MRRASRAAHPWAIPPAQYGFHTSKNRTEVIPMQTAPTSRDRHQDKEIEKDKDKDGGRDR